MNTETCYLISPSSPVNGPALSKTATHHGQSAIFVALAVAIVGCGWLWKSNHDARKAPRGLGQVELGQIADRGNVAMGPASRSAASTKVQLTFDDGPHPIHTPAILDWLKARNMRATFFVLGQNVERYPDLMRRIVAEGHAVGNHSWSHPKLSVMSTTKVREQLQRTQDAILKVCGKKPLLFRPPYGALSATQRMWFEKVFGLKTLLWDIDTLDWQNDSTEVIVKRIRDGIKSGKSAVLLAHDIHPRILPALEIVFPNHARQIAAR